jgi:hypothetical protein
VLIQESRYPQGVITVRKNDHLFPASIPAIPFPPPAFRVMVISCHRPVTPAQAASISCRAISARSRAGACRFRRSHSPDPRPPGSSLAVFSQLNMLTFIRIESY